VLLLVKFLLIIPKIIRKKIKKIKSAGYPIGMSEANYSGKITRYAFSSIATTIFIIKYGVAEF